MASQLAVEMTKARAAEAQAESMKAIEAKLDLILDHIGLNDPDLQDEHADDAKVKHKTPKK